VATAEGCGIRVEREREEEGEEREGKKMRLTCGYHVHVISSACDANSVPTNEI
jgi:hypothetical protein